MRLLGWPDLLVRLGRWVGIGFLGRRFAAQGSHRRYSTIVYSEQQRAGVGRDP
jgi:hypothetical protein